MDIEKEIKEFLDGLDQMKPEVRLIFKNIAVCLTHQQSIISQQTEEIKRLTDLRLHRMEVENGAMNFHISGEAGMAFAAILVRFFEDNGGKNFFSFDLRNDEIHYSINIQKVNGELSPTEKMNQQEAEIDMQRKYIGFLQSCTRSGEKWEGTIDDFIKKLEEENPHVNP